MIYPREASLPSKLDQIYTTVNWTERKKDSEMRGRNEPRRYMVEKVVREHCDMKKAVCEDVAGKEVT